MKKVKFLRVPSSSVVRGIYSGATGGGYVVPGDACNPNEGGGFLSSVDFAGGFLYFRKVDKDGKPLRNYGVASIKGDRKANIEGDGVAVAAEGFVIVFDDEKEAQKAGK
jgi:hypothetical protein